MSKHLLSGTAPHKEKRKPAQIVQELHQSMSNLKLELDLFRKEAAQDER